MQESKLLRVSGILMIIGAALSCLLGVLALVALGAAGAAGVAGAGGAVVAASAVGMVAVVVLLAGAILQLVAGILGVKNWNNPAKAKSCIIMGVILIVLRLISTFTGMGDADTSYWISTIVGFIIPVIYLVGAFQLNKANPA